MTHQERRDEIINNLNDMVITILNKYQEYKNTPYLDGNQYLSRINKPDLSEIISNDLSAFILSEQSKAVEEVSKILKTFKEEYLDFDPEEYPNNVHEVIKDYLSIADKYTKQGE